MNFSKTGQPLTTTGITSCLVSMGMHPDEAALLWAVISVETSGFGYDAFRRPRILFERHIFRRLTNGRFDESHPGISGPPGNYGTSAAQYERLETAMDACETAGLGVEPALKSASWGLGQVLGTNHASAGFPTSEAMVAAMVESEDDQLRGMTSFLIHSNLVAPLVKRDWAQFAKRYNGANYWQHQYDVKLADAYARLSSGSTPNLVVRTAQVALNYLAYSPGAIDGVLGDRTRKALRSFRITEGLVSGEDLDGPVFAALCMKAGIR